jgi:hypothetical protein
MTDKFVFVGIDIGSISANTVVLDGLHKACSHHRHGG